MAHQIDPDKCVACGACESVCPEGAIKMGDSAYLIVAAKCADCGQCAGECPNEAISARVS